MGIEADSKMLKGMLPDETPLSNFVKLTEDHRRDRERRADAGDETAVLKFTRTPTAPVGQPAGRASFPNQRPTQVGQRPSQGPPVGVKRPWQPQAAPQPAWKRAAPSYTPIPAFRR